MSKSAMLPSIVQAPSATSATIFSATTQPDTRESATACIPIVMISSALRGKRTGTPIAASERSLTAGTVEDFDAGSSPTSRTTPPLGFTPYMLAWRMVSVARSTPGPLPYQTPVTPSWVAVPAGRSVWLPHTAVAASSSLKPGMKVMSCSARTLGMPWSILSTPPRGLPW
ncbi:hypothetical protein B0E55_06236 [Rhodococcus sp. 66b]|nr:hypothetical protein B0E55_06236 [Rhodococcus sp. 66b]